MMKLDNVYERCTHFVEEKLNSFDSYFHEFHKWSASTEKKSAYYSLIVNGSAELMTHMNGMEIELSAVI